MKKFITLVVFTTLFFSVYAQTYNRKNTYEFRDTTYVEKSHEIVNLIVTIGYTDTISFLFQNQNKLILFKVLNDIESISIDNQTKEKLNDCVRQPIDEEFESYPIYKVGDIYNPYNMQYSIDKIYMFYEKNEKSYMDEYYSNNYFKIE